PVQRRAGDVRVGADQPRRHHAIRAVDGHVHAAIEARADVEDRVAFEHDHAIAQQAMAAAVVGDDPAGPDRGALGAGGSGHTASCLARWPRTRPCQRTSASAHGTGPGRRFGRVRRSLTPAAHRGRLAAATPTVGSAQSGVEEPLRCGTGIAGPGYSMLRSAARRPGAVSVSRRLDGCACAASCPRASAVPPSAGGRISRLVRPSRLAVAPGKAPWKRADNVAGTESTRSASPRRIAATICFAARSALIETPGRLAPRLNQVNSRPGRPVNSALTCEPVRISPGAIVVTVMPLPASSARSPSEKPTAANFAEE